MRVLIVDDERVAREELKRLLIDHPGLEIAGEARDGHEAVERIETLRPDLLFLDIQMPGCTGFEVLERLEQAPRVIFTTAYDEFAIRAFEVNALDYLLKPIDPARLRLALSRLTAANPTLPALDRIFVRDGERCWLVRWGDILLLESEGNYTRLYFDNNRPLVPRSLSNIEPRLDPSIFFRAGRKAIVNLRAISKVDMDPAGALVLTMRGGQQVEMSRRQSQRLRELMSL